MYVFLVLEECCNGLLQPGDLLIYSDRGYERFRCVPLDAGAVGMATLDGKLDCIHPAEAVSLEARAALKLASAVSNLRPGPAVPASAPAGPPALRLLRLLKED